MTPRAMAFLATAIMLCASNVHAESVTIDDFSTPPGLGHSPRLTANGPFAQNATNLDSSSVIGGWRYISLQRLAGEPTYVDVFSSPNPGLFFSQGTGSAIATLIWDGANPSNGLTYGLDANLTSGGGDEFVLDVAGVTERGIDVKMTVYTQDANNPERIYSSTTGSRLVDKGGIVTFDFFTDFTGNANFADIDTIVLELNGSTHPGSCIALNSFRMAAPEPSTLLLAGVGVLVFLGVRRRWRRA
jgi:hypothetical protein